MSYLKHFVHTQFCAVIYFLLFSTESVYLIKKNLHGENENENWKLMPVPFVVRCHENQNGKVSV